MNQRILCVDDEPRVLAGLEAILMFDYDVSTATSGAEGLEAVRETEYAVVISDMRMPSMNGAEFLAAVREISPDTTRILLTGYSEVDAAISAINQGGVFRFLSKPAPEDILIPTVEDGLEQHRLRKAEKELLEGTVRGAVELLTSVLAIASPKGFARSNELKRLSSEIAKGLGISPGWDLDVASLLARLGWIAMPPDVLERHLAGEALLPEERKVIAESGETAARLVEHIPRLTDVAEVIRIAHRPIGLVQANRTARLGAVLNAALAVDLEMTRGASLNEALERADLKDDYRQALVGVAATEEERVSWVVSKVTADELTAGMILDEDVYMTNGNLIVKQGAELSAPMAARLQAFARNLGLKEPIRVRMRSSVDVTVG